jgi:hypothetical protein
LFNKLTTHRILPTGRPWQTFSGAAADQTKLFRGQRPFLVALKTFKNLPFLALFIRRQPVIKTVVEKFY